MILKCIYSVSKDCNYRFCDLYSLLSGCFCLQHVHVHVMPRRNGDFKNNDDIYDEVNVCLRVSGQWMKY